MIIVISIIMILLGIGMFPYGYYMQRGYTERAADELAQEWVLAHKAIRSWLEFDPIARTHARLFFIFQKGTSEIQSYLLSGSILPDLDNLTSTSVIEYKKYTMENGVQILGFSGSLLAVWDKVGYLISPPYGDGVFFTGSTQSGSLPDARIIVWYPGADTITGRAREILLRTYLR